MAFVDVYQVLTELLAKILKENNVLQVQINAEHLRKRFKRVLYCKKERRWSQQKNFFIF